MGRLDDVDLSLSLSADEERRRLEVAQSRLLELCLLNRGLLDPRDPGPAVCVVFEGWDAAGKGGTIRRMVSMLDPRHVRVSQFSKPDPTQLRRHWLERFWPALPAKSSLAILDRSWYGRVLVERVEGLATDEEWRRAYGEIVDFERMLVRDGMLLVKFWLHLSPEEQGSRFEGRQNDPFKRWKLTDEDWRNRARWDDYVEAVEDMLVRTDWEGAAWHILPAESKRYARVVALETLNTAIENALGLPSPGP
jgi:polyphosphate kinase 2 (PPK2 family)